MKVTMNPKAPMVPVRWFWPFQSVTPVVPQEEFGHAYCVSLRCHSKVL